MAAMEAGKPRLMLHACCGPCLIAPAEAYASEYDITVAYANPNIHLLDEYVRRRDTLLAYAGSRGLPVVELAYEPRDWVRAVGALAHDPKARCEACYALRLSAAAACAAEAGIPAVATTLTVSPHQDQDALSRSGAKACGQAGVAYVHRDFRPAFRDAQERARELGMYRQRFCGCLLSALEADREREARHAARGRRSEPATS